MGNQPQREAYVTWYHPPLYVVMAEPELEELENPVSRQNNMVKHYIATHLIIYLCLEAERRPWERVTKRWW